MSDRWEYMTVSWLYTTEEKLVEPGKWKRFWRQEFYIYRGAGDPERRLAWSTHDEDADAEKFLVHELLNEFGAEGWEVVGETVLDSTIFTEYKGWARVGTPARIRWTLKRPLGRS